ncbi:MAG TPA: hypothetical protein DCY07_01635 [Rhodospirillaceae bacterium]|nr:hypothetical protein [Rhodospirillaceae bacterium]
MLLVDHEKYLDLLIPKNLSFYNGRFIQTVQHPDLSCPACHKKNGLSPRFFRHPCPTGHKTLILKTECWNCANIIDTFH